MVDVVHSINLEKFHSKKFIKKILNLLTFRRKKNYHLNIKLGEDCFLGGDYEITKNEIIKETLQNISQFQNKISHNSIYKMILILIHFKR